MIHEHINNFKIIYEDINSKFKTPYLKKLEKIIKDKKIKEVSFLEIEDKLFEKKIISLFKKINIKVNQVKPPMFLTTRKEFKEYLSKYKKPFMANFYKLIRTKLNILILIILSIFTIKRSSSITSGIIKQKITT